MVLAVKADTGALIKDWALFSAASVAWLRPEPSPSYYHSYDGVIGVGTIIVSLQAIYIPLVLKKIDDVQIPGW